jgi:hypothetical protein
MKQVLNISLSALVFTAILFGGSALAYKPYYMTGPGTPGGTDSTPEGMVALRDIAAACAPAAALKDLEWNNVRALIETGGSLWQDRANSSAAYEVPIDGGVSSLYAGSLWMGGYSSDGQLKLAAITFRGSGNDYWPGPLSNDGFAEVDEATCNAYDRFFPTTRAESESHRQYFECLNDPTCEIDSEFPNGYSTPSVFFDYPAMGNTALNQDFYLAPFYDFDGDGFYDPTVGDYPWYDFLKDIDCANRRREDAVPLFGDRNFYWIFNDKGNVHSESNGEPIGMEVRAQAFAFSTNDEINNMTFYNYMLINQGTQTLTQTYFGSWIDADLGTASDDYVGCDVQRGLGYCYNGDAFDESSTSSSGYGENPPAVGVDFFEGPYQDEDDVDNPLTTDFSDATDSLGIPYRGIGIGYGDGINDNERFGMRRFVYYENGSSPIFGEPSTPLHYYNYMNGIWKNNDPMTYGSNGVGGDVECDYMFPGDTDPYNWGTGGTSTEPWTEQTANNDAGDRRFIQAAGPFTLEPGDYNNITVGVVWARASAGDPFASVELMRIADDKAQALFDNCFEIVSGPDAPDVTFQELDKELILYLTNENPISNNYQENYLTFDPGTPEWTSSGEYLDTLARSYTFQGYMIYQLVDGTVGPDELENVERARLIDQCDVSDEVGMLINYAQDATMEIPVPALMVNGENAGIRHSFQLTKDAFAQGSNTLINYKTYYFMAIAYGYNYYEPYNSIALTGQSKPYLASRKSAIGSIRTYTAIPHPVMTEAGGTIQAADYGDGVSLTRLEGKGCGDNILDIDAATEARIVAEVRVPEVTYVAGAGPVAVYVVDPLKVPFGDFELRLAPDREDIDPDSDPEACFWQLTNLTLLNDEDPDNDLDAVRTSQDAISVRNEDLLMDWGLAVTWEQYDYPNDKKFTEPLASTIEFDDPTQPWLGGLADQEGIGNFYNWIRSGNQETPDGTPTYEAVFDDMKPGDPFDEDEVYEGILGGTWAPYALVSWTDNITFEDGSTSAYPAVAPTIESLKGNLGPITEAISGINNVDVVLTSDKSLWTRCPVLEMQPNEALAQNLTGETPEKMHLRRHASVDKNGLTATEGGNASQANLTGPEGMGWFPGYAIDIGTGERLNMAFGEDSWASADNGKDMLFNPSNRLTGSLGQAYAGGQHWIYIFKNQQFADDNSGRVPAYDQGAFLYDALGANFSSTMQRRVFRACTWVGSSLLNDGFEMLSPQDGLVPGRVKIRLRVAKRYERYSDSESDVDLIDGSVNNNNNIYTFSTRDVASEVLSNPTLIEELENIRIVPNPYYAMSKYETSKLDNRIKVTGLPEECTVRIYNIQGTLIRTYQKADPLTFLDWDLKNSRNVPIAGGLYIVHVDVPGVGEKVLKWFGVMRPTDLDNL